MVDHRATQVCQGLKGESGRLAEEARLARGTLRGAQGLCPLQQGDESHISRSCKLSTESEELNYWHCPLKRNIIQGRVACSGGHFLPA